MIAFRAPFSSPTVRRFPLPRTIIAPFWADLVIEQNIGATYYRLVQDSTTLMTIGGGAATLNSEFSNFHPTFAVIITWLNSSFVNTNQKIFVSRIIVSNLDYIKLL